MTLQIGLSQTQRPSEATDGRRSGLIWIRL